MLQFILAAASRLLALQSMVMVAGWPSGLLLSRMHVLCSRCLTTHALLLMPTWRRSIG